MLTSELLTNVHEYIDGELSVQELEDWLVPRLPLFFSLPGSFVTDLVAAIELGLAEMGSGVASEEKFRASIRESLWRINIFEYHPESQPITSTGSSSDLIHSVLSSGDVTVWVAPLPL